MKKIAVTKEDIEAAKTSKTESDDSSEEEEDSEEDSDSDDSGSDSESSTRAIKNKKHKVQPGQGNHKRRITWNFENTMVPQPVEKPKAHVKDWLAAKRRRREKTVNV